MRRAASSISARVLVLPVGHGHIAYLAQPVGTGSASVLAEFLKEADHPYKRDGSSSSHNSHHRPHSNSKSGHESDDDFSLSSLSDPNYWRHKAAKVAKSAYEGSMKTWDSMGTAPSESWQRTVHSAAVKVLDTIPLSEVLLRDIPETATYVSVLLPPKFDQSRVAEHLAYVAKHGQGSHKTWRIAALAGLPVTASLGFLPGPNFFFYYNAFRVYCHHRALAGAQSLQRICENGDIDYFTESALDIKSDHIISDAQAEEIADETGFDRSDVVGVVRRFRRHDYH